ncbi:MAG: peptidylprolyl isomerase [bacterium]
MRNTLNIVLGVIALALVTWIVVKPSKPNPTISPSPSAQLSTIEKGSSPMPSSTTKQYLQATQVIQAGKTYTATIKTSVGDITVGLSQDTPITTNNFVFLAKEGFYNDIIFHRVIPGFMIQGGDPTGTGTGGPGYKFADEKFSGEYKRGTIAMANSGANTNGSQFFIMHADYALPPNYVIFGQTISGLDIVDKIATAQTGPNDRPVNPVSIKSIEITEK